MTAKTVMLPFEMVSDSVSSYIEDKRRAELQRREKMEMDKE